MASNLEQLEQIIRQIMSADNAQRGLAEQAFNETKKNPDFLITSLLHLIRHSDLEEVKTLSSVLLRRVLGQGSESLWGTLSTETQATVKRLLLESITVEQNPKLRQKFGDIVSELGSVICSKGQWNELLPFLFDCSKSEQESHREIGLQIFSSLASDIDDQLRPYFAVLKDVLLNGLNDPKSLKVRIAALTATCRFLQVFCEAHEIAQFQQLTPYMLGCVSAALNAHQEDEARSAMEMFVEMAEFDPTFLRPHLDSIVPAMQTIATANNLEDGTKHLGIEFLVTLAEKRPGMTRKVPKYVETLVPILLNLMLDLDDDSSWYTGQDGDEVDMTNSDVGEESLDRISLALGGKMIVPVLFHLLPSFFSHADWRYRHTALMALSIVGEGCHAAFEPNLGEIIKTIVPFFRDPHPRVRWAACNTCGQMSSDFGPDLQEQFHSQVLPNLLAVMDDTENPRVQSHAASAVINFCEHGTTEILAPYLDGLITKLLTLLQQGKVMVQEQSITALAAIADCTKDDFSKYYDTVVPMLKSILSTSTANSKEYRTLRGKAMECVTLIGVSVGKEKFMNDAKQIMELLSHTQTSTMEPDDPQISFLLQAWARICRCLGQDFVPFLGHVMPPLLHSAKLSPDVTVTNADSAEVEGEDEGWDFIPVGDKRIGIHTSALEEKSTACNMLYCYASELGEGFFPYVDEVAKLLVPLLKFYYHDGVRSAAVTTMPHLLISAKKYFEKSNAAAGAGRVYNLGLFDYMFQPLVDSIKEEVDMEMTVAGIEAFVDCIEAIGENALNNTQMPKVMEMTFSLLKDINTRRTDRLSRKREEDHDEEEEEKLSEEEERDQEIMSQLAELVGRTIKSCQQSFLPYFDHLLPTVSELLQSSRSSDRQSAICIYDDLVDYLGPLSIPYFDKFLPSMINSIADPDPTVRQAAVYGLGCCALAGGEHIKPAVPEILSRMSQLISHPDARSPGNVNPTENAISAVGKILLHQSNAVNMTSAMQTWLSWLPVTVDKVESKVTYSQLCTFLESSNPHILGEGFKNLPKIVSIFGVVIGTDLVDEDLVKRMVRVLQQMRSNLPSEALQAGWNTLSAEQQQKLQQFMAAVQ